MTFLTGAGAGESGVHARAGVR